MTPFIVLIIVGLGALLMVWNITRFRGFQRDYAYEGEFPGTPYECDLHSNDSEGPLRCRIGATDSALYLMADPRFRPKKLSWLWGNYNYRNFRATYKTNLRIPWTDLTYRAGSMFFKDVIWFENRARRFYVYVPREIGEKLLRDAGREIPPRN